MTTSSTEHSQRPETVSEGPITTLSNVLHCQAKEWRQHFASLTGLPRKNVCIQGITIELPPFFRQYLLQDGVQLPPGTKTSGFLPENDDSSDVWSQQEKDYEEKDDDHPLCDQHDDEDITSQISMDFTELNQIIEDAIQKLGGAVVPKLNWSTPRDATWIHSGTLKCQTPGDIYLLLKSSDFCAFDVQYALTQDVVFDEIDAQAAVYTTHPLQLTLTKWCNLYPSQEFRCFVRQQQLIAISQRHHSQHFPHLLDDAHRTRDLIHDFFLDYVKGRFPDRNYVFDVYVDQKSRVWLVDFNVWGIRTDSLMFHWSELDTGATSTISTEISENDRGTTDSLPLIRCVQTSKEVRPDPLSTYRAPIDTVHVANMTGSDAEQFKELFQN